MTIMMLKITPLAEKRHEVLEILGMLKVSLLIRNTSTICETYEACNGDREVLYMEQWYSRDAMNLHIQSDLWLRILAVIEMSARPPKLRFFEVAEHEETGLKLIEALRCPELETKSLS